MASSYFTPDWITTLATNLLSTIGQIMEGSDQPPVRSVLDFGTNITRDCAQIALTVPQIFSIRPSTGRRGGLAPDPGPIEPVGIIPAVAFLIEVTRCIDVPVITGTVAPVLPTADEITGWSQGLLTDGWLLFRGLIKRREAGTLFSADGVVPLPQFPPLCQRTKINPLVPIGPEAGIAGWQIQLQTNLA